MRDIRFRAWDKETKSMRYEGFVVTYDGQGMYVGDESYHIFGDYVVLMQYTGLKDKNGKEIYEGDVVVDEYAFNRIGESGIRNFPALHGVVKWEHIPANEDYETAGFVGFNIDPSQVYVAIGNIYENPELLEAKEI